MNSEKCFYTGTHPYSFRSGQPAEVVGVNMVDPAGKGDWRPCFHVRFPDGVEDFCPVLETQHYELGRHTPQP